MRASRTRSVARLAIVGLIVGLGAYKADENQRDRAQQQAYLSELERLEREGSEEYQKLSAWTKRLFTADNARRVTREKLNGGKPWETRAEGDYEVASWRHPNYGIELEFTFAGDDLVSFGATTGAALIQENRPRPRQFSRYDANGAPSKPERLRRLVQEASSPVWLVGFTLAFFAPQFGRSGAELMIGASLSGLAAHLVDPHQPLRDYWLTGPEWFALTLHVVSVVMLALRSPRGAVRWRFGVKQLLLLMTGASVLLAIGPFGWLMLGVLASSAVLYAFVRHLRPAAAHERC